MTILVTVNGKPQKIAAPTLLLDFLAQLDLDDRPIAVGYNGEVVHKDCWPQVTLGADDVLDIVHMVGGG